MVFHQDQADAKESVENILNLVNMTKEVNPREGESSSFKKVKEACSLA